MDQKKIMLIGGITILLIAAIAVWGISSGKQAEQAAAVPDKDIIYYYGAECPHCKRVNEFLEQNDVASKMEFTKKEVWHDRKNSQEMQGRAQSCGMAANAIGVPFIYIASENRCLTGEPDVIGFFSERAGLSEEQSENANQ